jgi:membrane-bound serine protease (ClpP class)
VDGRTVDVVTDGIFVESGTRVRVARVEGARVVVEPE